MFGIRKRSAKTPTETKARKSTVSKLPYLIDPDTLEPIIETDPSTGLPKLTPGWYWEVKIEVDGGWVWLRGPDSDLTGPTGIWQFGGFTATLKHPEDITEDDIKLAALEYIWKVPAKVAKRESIKAQQEKFNGKYPPKALKGN
jgi:hypothetical protein